PSSNAFQQERVVVDLPSSRIGPGARALGASTLPCRRRRILQSRYLFRIYLTFLLFLSGVGQFQARAGEPSLADVEFFEKEVRPLLVATCWKCHGEARPKGGLKLTSRAHVLQGGDSGPAAVAGKPEESLLVRAVRYQDTPRMPPQGKLGDRQIAVLTRWVKGGLPWPGSQTPSAPEGGPFTITEKQRRFWSFQPVKAV